MAKSSKTIKRSYEYQMGYEACRIGTSRFRNPYNIGTPEQEDWRMGWQKRFWGEELYSEP